MRKKVAVLVGVLLVFTALSATYVVGGTQAYSRFQQTALMLQRHCGDQASVHICVNAPKAVFSAFYPSYVATHAQLFTVEYSSSSAIALTMSVSITNVSQVETHPVQATTRIKQLRFMPRIPNPMLNSLTQETNTFLHVQVSDATKQNYYVNDIPLLVHSRWLMEWTRANRLQIAAWITPDDSNVHTLVEKATLLLKRQTPPTPSGMSGYNVTSTQQIKDQVDALYDALRAQNIHYINTTVPYTGTDTAAVSTQKVQLPSEVLKQHSGMCIELTLLLAAAVENIGLKAEIVIVQGHAFLGVAIKPDETLFEYWDVVGAGSGVAGDSANVATDALYTKDAQQHTIVDTILVSQARKSGIGPML